jgi:hypothetical protein
VISIRPHVPKLVTGSIPSVNRDPVQITNVILLFAKIPYASTGWLSQAYYSDVGDDDTRTALRPLQTILSVVIS